MTLDEEINLCERRIEELYKAIPCDGCAFQKCKEENEQLAEWLRELKAYRKILANADKIIASEYGCVIIEGYADIIDKMNEVYKEVNADENKT